MDLPLPSWFRYRQGIAEPAGEHCYKLRVPVIGAAFSRVRAQEGRWQAAVAQAPDGPDLHATEPKFAQEAEAWHAAFELYKSTVIY